MYSDFHAKGDGRCQYGQFNSIKTHGINNIKIKTWKFRRLMKFEIKEKGLIYLDTVKF